MRTALLVIAVCLGITGCDNTPAERLEGDFLYTADAAVLQVGSIIYGVTLDETAARLGEQVKGYQKEEFDMVPVIITGVIETNEDTDGWEQFVTIKEILAVMHPKGDQGIQIKSIKEN